MRKWRRQATMGYFVIIIIIGVTLCIEEWDDIHIIFVKARTFCSMNNQSSAACAVDTENWCIIIIIILHGIWMRVCASVSKVVINYIGTLW